MKSHSDPFDWCADKTVAVRSQAALAVYSNHDGEVIVGEQAQWPDSEDCFVVINREHIPTIVCHLPYAAGLEDIRLIRQFADGACEDYETHIRNTRPDLDLDAALAEFDAKHIPDTSEVSAQFAQKPLTGAERQRRYRGNKRNGAASPVTANGQHVTLAPELHLNGGEELAHAS